MENAQNEKNTRWFVKLYGKYGRNKNLKAVKRIFDL
jgi:hypothetical protein